MRYDMNDKGSGRVRGKMHRHERRKQQRDGERVHAEM